MHKDDYENKLRSLGCDLVGKGLYANVFAIPMTDKVIKVAEQDRWPDYIQWATERGYAGTFAPKVYSLKFKREGYYVAIMERLVCTVGEFRYETGESSDQARLYRELTGYYHRDKNKVFKTDQFFGFVRELFAANFSGDLHDQNVMVRRDGQLVVTDPSSGTSRARSFRIKSGAVNYL